ncbi:GTP-binding protein [Streptomyces sp. NPDC002004]
MTDHPDHTNPSDHNGPGREESQEGRQGPGSPERTGGAGAEDGGGNEGADDEGVDGGGADGGGRAGAGDAEGADDHGRAAERASYDGSDARRASYDGSDARRASYDGSELPHDARERAAHGSTQEMVRGTGHRPSADADRAEPDRGDAPPTTPEGATEHPRASEGTPHGAPHAPAPDHAASRPYTNGTTRPRDDGRGNGPQAAPADRPRGTAIHRGQAAAPHGSFADYWDDGLIARRISEEDMNDARTGTMAGGVRFTAPAPTPPAPTTVVYDGPLRTRLDALRELVGLSRTRLDSGTLAEAGRVLDEAAARRRLSDRHTVIALAGATGSGKSTLFNALAGVTISDTGVRRPTTSQPISCTWTDGASGLLDRLGIPGRLRRRPLRDPDAEVQLEGLVLIDLPDHDSASVEHRAQVDRVLALVDAVIWVVDPEKYADAALHERYLRPMAGHAEVMFVVLNQVDRLPGDAAHQVLDDLRRLLDEDGIALGEYGESGMTVLPVSAMTGEGMSELREVLDQFVTERSAAVRRIEADLDAAADRLRPLYAAGRRSGLTEDARERFSDRLAEAVGATAAGEAAERAWRRNASKACGTPWLRLWRWYQDQRTPDALRPAPQSPAEDETTARQRVEQAVRTVAEQAASGLPAAWGQAVREAAARGAKGLPEALDEMAVKAGVPAGRPPRPGWWPLAVLVQALMTIVQIVGGLWLVGQIVGVSAPNLGVPVLLMLAGIIGGPCVEWLCRVAARGPARRYGLEAERRLHEAAASCGRARVLDPVAAELLRYREVREQYVRVVGTPAGSSARASAPARAR